MNFGSFKMPKIVLALTLFCSIFASRSAFAQLTYDSWTSALNNSDTAKPSYAEHAPADLADVIGTVIKRNPKAQITFTAIYSQFTQYSFTTIADFTRAAADLVNIRQAIRELNPVPKDTLFLLEDMSEEPLIVGQAKFKDFPKTHKVVNDKAT